MATSFRKKATARPEHPRGTRPSLHNAQLLVSTGVPSLDVLLGGGLPVGGVLLVEEDEHAVYSYLLLKYFLSEGVMSGHSLLLGSASQPPASILAELPGPTDEEHGGGVLPSLTEETVEQERGEEEEEEMKIAWRYQSKPRVQSSFSNRYGHFFDLTRNMAGARVEAVESTLIDLTTQQAKSSTEFYATLTNAIAKSIQDGKLSLTDTTATTQRTALRIVLHSLGSPLWLEEGAGESGSCSSPHYLARFLHTLRGMLRQAYASALITMPTHLFQDAAFVRRLERLSDSVVRLESFAGSVKEQNPAYKEYHGLFHIVKLPRMNSLTCHYPETLDLAFKLKRKKFSIERLHLPPELSEIASRPQEDKITPRTTSGRRHGTRADRSSGRTNSSSRTGPSIHNIDF